MDYFIMFIKMDISKPNIIEIFVGVLKILFLGLFISGCEQQSYADKCAEAMGNVPSFNCLYGTEIPITKNGVQLHNSPEDNECDKKIQFDGQKDNPCVPSSQLLILPSRKGVLTIAICRKYSQNSIDDEYFDDIAVIQHDKLTGKTCFFQSDLDIEPKLDGKHVPSPQQPNPENIWVDSEALSVSPCTNCHDADPFVWSPYIAQVTISNEKFQALWEPGTVFGPWDSNFLNLFGSPVKTFEPEHNVCAFCHRIGSNTCKNIQENDTISMMEKYAHEGFMPLGRGNMMPREHPFFNKESHIKNCERALLELKKCCEKPNDLYCNTKVATGKNVERLKSKRMIGNY